MSRSLPPLGDALKALAAEDPPLSHPELDGFLAYRDGALPADQAESLREHLVACAECAARLLDLGSFLAAEPPEGEAPVSDGEVAAAWEAMQRRLPGSRPAEPTARPTPSKIPPPPSRARHRARLLWPLAAGFVAATALLALWMLFPPSAVRAAQIVDLDFSAPEVRGATEIPRAYSSSRPIRLRLLHAPPQGPPLYAIVLRAADGQKIKNENGKESPRGGDPVDLGTFTLGRGVHQVDIYERGNRNRIRSFSLQVD